MTPRRVDRSRDRRSPPTSPAAVDGRGCPGDEDDGGDAAPFRADGGGRVDEDGPGSAAPAASADPDDGAAGDPVPAVDDPATEAVPDGPGDGAGVGTGDATDDGTHDGTGDATDDGTHDGTERVTGGDTGESPVDLESVLAARRTTHADATDGEVTVRGGGRERREVVVPLRLYKAVTVFSTLIAVVLVVLGFGFLDAATTQGGLFAAVGDLLPAAVPVVVPADAAGPVFAVAGLACVAVGAGVYVLGSRFRTAAMGKGKDDADGESDNG